MAQAGGRPCHVPWILWAELRLRATPASLGGRADCVKGMGFRRTRANTLPVWTRQGPEECPLRTLLWGYCTSLTSQGDRALATGGQGPRVQGHGSRDSLSFLLPEPSSSSYIPARCWSPCAGDAWAGPSRHGEAAPHCCCSDGCP